MKKSAQLKKSDRQVFWVFFCTAHRALVYTRGSRLRSISLSILLLLLLHQCHASKLWVEVKGLLFHKLFVGGVGDMSILSRRLLPAILLSQYQVHGCQHVSDILPLHCCHPLHTCNQDANADNSTDDDNSDDDDDEVSVYTTFSVPLTSTLHLQTKMMMMITALLMITVMMMIKMKPACTQHFSLYYHHPLHTCNQNAAATDISYDDDNSNNDDDDASILATASL